MSALIGKYTAMFATLSSYLVYLVLNLASLTAKISILISILTNQYANLFIAQDTLLPESTG